MSRHCGAPRDLAGISFPTRLAIHPRAVGSWTEIYSGAQSSQSDLPALIAFQIRPKIKFDAAVTQTLSNQTEITWTRWLQFFLTSPPDATSAFHFLNGWSHHCEFLWATFTATVVSIICCITHCLIYKDWILAISQECPKYCKRFTTIKISNLWEVFLL